MTSQGNDERFHRADALLEQALDHPPDERDRWVSEQCEDDPELLSLVKRLLRYAEETGHRLTPGGALEGEVWAKGSKEPIDGESLPGGVPLSLPATPGSG